MAKRKFTTAGETAEKTKWNKAKTRKWKMTYELVEVKPAKKRRKRTETAAKSERTATKKSRSKTTTAKRTTKRKASTKRKPKASA